LGKQTFAFAVTSALSCFTSQADGRPCLPLDHACSGSQKRVRHEQHPQNAEVSACFRLRHGDSRFAPAPFRPSLRLRCTFPFAEPQAEAKF